MKKNANFCFPFFATLVVLHCFTKALWTNQACKLNIHLMYADFVDKAAFDSNSQKQSEMDFPLSPLPDHQTCICNQLPTPSHFLLCYCCDSHQPSLSVKRQAVIINRCTSLQKNRKCFFFSNVAQMKSPRSIWLAAMSAASLAPTIVDLIIFRTSFSTTSPLSLSEFPSPCPATLLTALTAKQTRIQVQQSLRRLTMTATESRIHPSPVRGGWMWPGRLSDTSTASCTEVASSGPSVRRKTR